MWLQVISAAINMLISLHFARGFVAHKHALTQRVRENSLIKRLLPKILASRFVGDTLHADEILRVRSGKRKTDRLSYAWQSRTRAIYYFERIVPLTADSLENLNIRANFLAT